ncbi:MAG TPA: DUF423 domain-containing protein [Candidatus Sulfopaludibacter sp.]|jgi:uncharacterized membrane protein YgdD (TMEM256/DUF423 family)|nr:DUF423 domain-containing protein [Candidatus Sulfopaludibacter sp.]
MNWSQTGAILLALSVILGAFGAHGLRDRLDAYSMDVYQKAVFYQFIHSLGILIVGILPKTGTFPLSSAGTVCTFLLAGIVIFSGSLYLLAVTGNRMLGAITPIGGVCFIVGWVLLAWYLRRITL